MKYTALLLLLLLLLGAVTLTACGGEPAENPESLHSGGDTLPTTAAEPLTLPAEPPTEPAPEGVTHPATEPPTEAPTEAEPPYTVTVTLSIEGSATSTGGALTQTVASAVDYVPVHIRPALGYVCAGYELDGVFHEGSIVRVTHLTADTEITVRMDYATYELPIVLIDTGGEPVTSKAEYVDMRFTLLNTEDVMLNVGGRVRVRGNSTSRYGKKPYRLQFNQKHSLFGLEKAKSWVLLADYLDPSTLHTYAAMGFSATSEHLVFTPTVQKVNVYLNGQYRGLYTLCEQVDENPGRMDIETEITRSMRELSDYNYAICMNENAPEKPGAEEGVTYFYLSGCGRYFELEYPRREDFPTESQFRSFFTQLEDHIREVTRAFMNDDLAFIRRHVDMDSIIDYMIIDQIMGERDHWWKSFFLYHTAESGRLAAGPIWDYDFCLYTEWTGEPNREYEIKNILEYSNIFFRFVARNDAYLERAKTRYREHFSPLIPRVARDVKQAADAMPESLALNTALWYPKEPELTEDNLEFLIDYLTARRRFLDRVW